MRKKMISNYGVILRQIRNGKELFCYTAFSKLSRTAICLE